MVFAFTIGDTPKSERPMYIATYSAITGFAAFLGPVAGGKIYALIADATDVGAGVWCFYGGWCCFARTWTVGRTYGAGNTNEEWSIVTKKRIGLIGLGDIAQKVYLTAVIRQ